MSKAKGSKRRRCGVVDAPSLEEIMTTPKKLRLETSPAGKPHESWSSAEVSGFLHSSGLPETVVQVFEEHQIEGRHLLDITQQDLKTMGIRTVGKQKDILRLLKALQGQRQLNQDKIFNDPIHGHIELHPLMVKIIDTPQFQRLRYIKQLGGTYYVFPGASHNRFEHSIGVGYLAGELVETLQKKQPELSITDKDMLCIKIAGLCHDLGHGPFSHMFDGHFIPKIRPDINWKHEHASVAMFDHLLEENGLRPEFERFGLMEVDVIFIKEQIAGPLESELCSQTVSSDWPYQGRPDSMSFLYEIVANKRNGVDVDKWDYFARDCHCLGIPNNFDMRRYMKFARVINVNNRRQICTRDKEVVNLYEMFHTRSSLHRRAYQHKTAKVIEHMISEALAKANDHFLIPGKDRPVKMSEAIYDMHAYTRLTDHVIQQILLSTEQELEESRKLLQKVERRELYKCIGQTQPANTASKISKDQTPVLAQEIISSLKDEDLGDLPRLTVDDILVDVITFDYGMKDENPIDHTRFYTKDSPQRAVRVRKDQVSQMLPQRFMEQHIRVYCKKRDQPSLQAAWKYFIHWCQKQDCITPKAAYKLDVADADESDIDDFGHTPYGTPFGTPVKQQEISKESHAPINPEEVVKKLRFAQ